MVAQRPDIRELKRICRDVRKDILISLECAKSGHPGGSLSCVEILVALYWYKMRCNPEEACALDRDRFVLSKGHVCPALYTVLAHKGYFPREQLCSLRRMGSCLQGHPHMLKLGGLETSSGSLGQGLSVSVGMALGAKADRASWRVYCLMGDGETDEGQIWEAAMAAHHYKLDNLCGIVDRNRLQIDGDTEQVMSLEPYADKWRAFGWEVLEVDGHDLVALMDAYDKAETIKGKPTVVLANTVKGKGVSFMENVADWHGKAPKKEELEKAIAELDALPI
jgi:transketolase